jgi:HEAT repeat protein
LIAHHIWRTWHAPLPCLSSNCGPQSFGDWPFRDDVLRQLDPEDGVSTTEQFLIRSLLTENEYLRWRRTQTLPDLCEDYGDYYITLALAVSQLDSARAIPALTGAIDVAPAIATTLASYGDPAVRPVLAQLQDPLAADGAAYTLGRFVEGRREHGVAVSRWNLWRIRRALVRLAMREGDPAIRGTAIRSLGEFDPDAALRTLLNRLESDPRLRTDVDAVRSTWTLREEDR